MAEIIKQGPFDIIISTNIDDLLEKALEHVEMKELHDFTVLIPGHVSMRIYRMSASLIIKVFGEIYSREYNVIKRNFFLDY